MVRRIVDYNASLLPKAAEQGICFFATRVRRKIHGTSTCPWVKIQPAAVRSLDLVPKASRRSQFLYLYLSFSDSRSSAKVSRWSIASYNWLCDVPGLCCRKISRCEVAFTTIWLNVKRFRHRHRDPQHIQFSWTSMKTSAFLDRQYRCLV